MPLRVPCYVSSADHAARLKGKLSFLNHAYRPHSLDIKPLPAAVVGKIDGADANGKEKRVRDKGVDEIDDNVASRVPVAETESESVEVSVVRTDDELHPNDLRVAMP
eukprot:SAG11_NODE_1668_length_4494_cov_1.724460_3_plen_107_part_00